jgi:hypothetical protein
MDGFNNLEIAVITPLLQSKALFIELKESCC